MYYHASSVAGIQLLEPRISNHHIPLIYFSKKRENVLVYLSNAVEKYCVENDFQHTGVWRKWATYGFDRDGVQRIEEYYPNALFDTYKGVGGWIYSARYVEDCGFQVQIPDAASSDKPVAVDACEFVSDAYEAILMAQQQGLIRITRYEELSEARRGWIQKTISEEYQSSGDAPDYQFFLRGKFGELPG